MRRLLIPLLLVFLASPVVRALAEEPARPVRAPKIDPAEVARLLISDKKPERTRGAALLLQRVRQGGSIAVFLRAMADEQARWANATDRLVGQWIEQVRSGTPEARERALRLLEAAGPEAAGRLDGARRSWRVGKTAAVPLPPGDAVAGSKPPSATAPAPASGAVADNPSRDVPSEPPAVTPPAELATGKEDAPPGPGLSVRADVILIPREEVERWLAHAAAPQQAGSSFGPVAVSLRRVLSGRTIVGGALTAPEIRTTLEGLPDVRVVRRDGTAVLRAGRESVLVESARQRYRRSVRRTPQGAWAVDTDTFPRGIEVRLSLGSAGRPTPPIAVEVRHVAVPTPLAVIRKQPAENVEPVELDRPEWRVASARCDVETTSPEGHDAVTLFPEVVPEYVVLVHLRW